MLGFTWWVAQNVEDECDVEDGEEEEFPQSVTPEFNVCLDWIELTYRDKSSPGNKLTNKGIGDFYSPTKSIELMKIKAHEQCTRLVLLLYSS